jgi:hypothetical protein
MSKHREAPKSFPSKGLDHRTLQRPSPGIPRPGSAVARDLAARDRASGPPLAAALGLLALAGCANTYQGWDGYYYVDGRRLTYDRSVSLELPGSGLDRFEFQGATADVIMERGDVPHATAHIHEVVPGDAYLVFEDGELLLRTRSGAPAVIDAAEITLSEPLQFLVLELDDGKVELRDLQVADRVRVSTDLGDVIVRSVGQPQFMGLVTGLGDILVEGVTVEELALDTDLGDVTLRDVSAELARLSTNMGDVEVQRCSLGELEASTSLGDIRGRESDIGRTRAKTSLGTVQLP